MGNHQSNQRQCRLGVATPKRSNSKVKLVPDSVTTLAQLLVDKSAGDHVGGHISRATFLKYFSNCVESFAERLYEHYVSKQDTLDVHYITKETFIKISEEILELHTTSLQLKYCFKAFAKGKDHLTVEGVTKLFRTCFLLASDGSSCNDVGNFCTPVAEQIVSAMISSAMKDNESIPIDALTSWVLKNCGNMMFGIHRWITHRLLNVDASHLEINCNGNDMTSRQSNSFPLQSNILNPLLLWLLTCSLPIQYTKPNSNKPSLNKMLNCHLDPHTFIQKLLLCSNTSRWTPLYDSSNQGLSINRFQHHVFSYRGPNVVLITAEDNRLFCIAVDEEWKESTNRWGGEDCVLMQITPKYKVIETGSKMIYLNLTTRGYPHGIHVGQSSKTPHLEINTEMTYIYVQKIPYKLLNIEVWGCAGEEKLEAQIQHKRWEAQEAQRHHRINLNAVEWKDNPDKFLLDLVSSKPSYSPSS